MYIHCVIPRGVSIKTLEPYYAGILYVFRKQPARHIRRCIHDGMIAAREIELDSAVHHQRKRVQSPRDRYGNLGK